MGAYNALTALYDTGAYSGRSVPNMLQRGNVDVNHRPTITNADGSKSSIYSMTVPLDKSGNPVAWESPDAVSYALVPSIANGKFLTPNGKMPTTEAGTRALEQAATDYYKKTKQHLGIFNSPSAADEYATLNHDYGNNGTAAQVFSPSPTLSSQASYIQRNQAAPIPVQVSAPINMFGLLQKLQQ